MLGSSATVEVQEAGRHVPRRDDRCPFSRRLQCQGLSAQRPSELPSPAFSRVWRTGSGIPPAPVDQMEHLRSERSSTTGLSRTLALLEVYPKGSKVIEMERSVATATLAAALRIEDSRNATAGPLRSGITVLLHPNDHPPPHVHIRFRSDPELQPAHGNRNRRTTRGLRKAAKIVTDRSDLLMERWMEMQEATPPHS